MHKKCKRLLLFPLPCSIIEKEEEDTRTTEPIRKEVAAMAAITAYKVQEVTAQQFNGLFCQFVEWIDGSEKTTRSYLTNLKQFAAWIRYQEITQPTRADIIIYRNWLAAEHEAIALDPAAPQGWTYRRDASGNVQIISCKPNTVALYLRSVSQFFKWTAANGYYPNIAENVHGPKLRHDTHRKNALTAREVLQIENSITQGAKAREEAAAGAEKDTAGRVQRSEEQGKRLKAIYLLSVNAGLRTIEISRAKIKDLETKGGQTYLYIWGKGHSEPDQKKPIAPEVAQAIREYLETRTDRPTGNSPLFVSTGNRSGGQAIATTTISTMLKQAMKEAGFNSERLTAHSLRHTAGTAVQELTGNLYTTQQYMRHSNPATTEIYLHNDTEKAEAGIAQQLYNLFHGIEETDKRAQLEQILNRMDGKKLEQLTTIAAAMV